MATAIGCRPTREELISATVLADIGIETAGEPFERAVPWTGGSEGSHIVIDYRRRPVGNYRILRQRHAGSYPNYDRSAYLCESGDGRRWLVEHGYDTVEARVFPAEDCRAIVEAQAVAGTASLDPAKMESFVEEENRELGASWYPYPTRA